MHRTTPPIDETFAAAFLSMQDSETAPDIGMRWETAEAVDRYIGPGPEAFYYSLRFHSLPPAALIDERIRQEIQLAKTRRRERIEWVEYSLPSVPLLRESLVRLGFVLKRECRLLYQRTTDLPSVPPADVRVVPVTAQNFSTLIEVNAKAFDNHDNEWLKRSLLPEIELNTPQVRAFLSFIDDTAACAAWIKQYGRCAYLFGGGTVPHLRGRGAYRALVRARMEHARREKVEFVMSLCSPDSRRVLSSLGFIDAGVANTWVKELTPCA